MTRNRQRWVLPPLGAQVPACRIFRISSSGTGSGFRRRMARMVCMVSKRSGIGAFLSSFRGGRIILRAGVLRARTRLLEDLLASRLLPRGVHPALLSRLPLLERHELDARVSGAWAAVARYPLPSSGRG